MISTDPKSFLWNVSGIGAVAFGSGTAFGFTPAIPVADADQLSLIVTPLQNGDGAIVFSMAVRWSALASFPAGRIALDASVSNAAAGTTNTISIFSNVWQFGGASPFAAPIILPVICAYMQIGFSASAGVAQSTVGVDLSYIRTNAQ